MRTVQKGLGEKHILLIDVGPFTASSRKVFELESALRRRQAIHIRVGSRGTSENTPKDRVGREETATRSEVKGDHKVDVLVNVADFVAPSEEWSKSHDCARQLMLSMEDELRIMTDASSGCVINLMTTGEVAATVSDATARAVITQLTRLAALDVAQSGVRCNAVVARIDGPEIDWDQIAATIEFLGGDESQYISGAVLHLDGGSETDG